MRTSPSRRCAAAMGAIISVAAFGMVTAPAANAAPVTIDLITFNDFHGRLEAETGVPGAAVLAGAIGSFRAANPNTLVASVGDSIGASTFTSFIQQDKPTLDVLDEVGVDVSSLGNHEFDAGRADLDGRVIPDINFPYLAANVYDRASGRTAYPAYQVESVAGISIGFIGAVTEELPSLVDPGGISTLEVKPIVPEVNRVAADLTDGAPGNGEADVLVLLVHEGAATANPAALTDGSPFAKILAGMDTDIDAVVSAHTHQAYSHAMDVAGWPAGVKRPVLQAGEYGTNVGKVSFTLDPVTKAVQATGSSVIPLLKPDGSPAFPKDAAVEKIVADAVAVAKVKGTVSVGTITASLRKARQTDGTTDNRGGESTIGNAIADAQLAAARGSGAQIALMNAGGIRTDLEYASGGPGDPAGNVTYREAANVQPFANTLVAFDLTGRQLKDALEQQWQPSGSARPMLKLGVSAGFQYTYNPTAAKGSRITRMSLNGVAVESGSTYRVVANKFLANGGDNFAALATGTRRADTGKVDLAALVDYLKTHPGLAPDLAQRAIGVNLSAPDADGYNGGDTVVVKLSSLLFSAGEKPASIVEVSFDGRPAVSAAIDPRVVDTTDEVGRAEATITLPPSTPGEHVLTVRVPETGTSTEVVIPITKRSPVAERSLSDANTTTLGSVLAQPGTVRAGQQVVVSVPAEYARGSEVVLYGPQRTLSTTLTEGGLLVNIPVGTRVGEHRIAVYTADGSIIGWTTVTVVAGGPFS